MNKLFYSLAFLTVTAFFSCTAPTSSNLKSPEENEVVVEKNNITLDNGAKWIANPETTAGVNNMKKLMAEFQDSENTENYSQLKDQLQAEFTMIFKKCTMKGEAHNQLHNFLIPIKNHLENLKNSDLTGSKATFYKLKDHLEIYQNYFV
jgi:hypothetical protein